MGSDDIEELKIKVCQVLNRLKEYRVKANWDKCNWFVSKVLYLGHEISKEGIAPNKEKVRAIEDAPSPKNVSQLKAFVGLINYYAKFVSELSIMLKPFYELLKKGNKWNWTVNCEENFKRCKKAILDSRILVHYDPRKPMVVVCDASDDGISAILCHIINGEEKPVFFTSRVLTSAEKNYPILHREALAIVFGLEKFYRYIFGYSIQVFTDHKPLLSIFSKRNCLKSGVIVSRLQRYLDRIAHFDFEIFYRVGSKNIDADCLSRLPVNDVVSNQDKQEENSSIRSIESDGEITLNLEIIKRHTDSDNHLCSLKNYILKGWPKSGIPKELKIFYNMLEDLNVAQGVIIYKERVVIPEKLKEATIKLLHTNHSGIVRMKELARRYVFWTGLSRDIENFVKSCPSCQKGQKCKRTKVYGKWPETTYPFERAHIDFFYFNGKQFLIFIDVYTRWLEVKNMRNLSAHCLIEQLDSIYEYFGYNKQLVTDNGPPFGSYEFSNYCKDKGIELIHTPPYHPQSNGVVERAVQSVKRNLRKLVFDAENSNMSFNLDKSLRNFLRKHRCLPTTSEGWIPAHRLLAFKPRWEMDSILIKERTKENQQEKPSDTCESKKNVRFNLGQTNKQEKKILDLKEGENVWYVNPYQGKVYRYEAKVVKRLTKFLYRIKLKHYERTVHVNQLERRYVRSKKTFVNIEGNLENCNDCNESINLKTNPRRIFDNVSDNDKVVGNTPKRIFRNRNLSEALDSERPLRRSSRERKPPQRLKLT
jgi:hypothetical protein